MNLDNKLISIFGSVEDHRSQLNNFVDILLIGIIYSQFFYFFYSSSRLLRSPEICWAEIWKQMVEFAYSKEVFLRKFLKLVNGIPSEDTIDRVFLALESDQFENCFIEWVNSISEISKGQVIAIDCKTLRGAKSKGTKSPVHMVSAYANESNLVLGQVRLNEKSNEITAIPELLEKLMVQENIITIDAMGIQTDVAEKIIENGTVYILAIKENQKQLLDEIIDEFKFAKDIEVDTHLDIGHGRIETRKCSVATNFLFIGNQNDKWKNLSKLLK